MLWLGWLGLRGKAGLVWWLLGLDLLLLLHLLLSLLLLLHLLLLNCIVSKLRCLIIYVLLLLVVVRLRWSLLLLILHLHLLPWRLSIVVIHWHHILLLEAHEILWHLVELGDLVRLRLRLWL